MFQKELPFAGIVFGIDFDGTCVMHDFPRIGEDCPGAVSTLRWILDKGGSLVLNTMRSDEFMDQALKWFDLREIKLIGANINPEQRKWTNSTKAYANYYIEDAALGCPLTFDNTISSRPFVDWKGVQQILDVLVCFKEHIITGPEMATE